MTQEMRIVCGKQDMKEIVELLAQYNVTVDLMSEDSLYLYEADEWTISVLRTMMTDDNCSPFYYVTGVEEAFQEISIWWNGEFFETAVDHLENPMVPYYVDGVSDENVEVARRYLDLMKEIKVYIKLRG